MVSPSGAIVCRSTLINPGNGCVPLNPFTRGDRSPASLAYFLGTAQSQLLFKEYAAAVNVTGEPFHLPAGPVSVAVGAEYRKNSARQSADPLSRTNAFVGANQGQLSGQLDIKEVFGEVVVPVLKNAPLIRNLDVSGAARHTDYSISGGVTTWKAGVNYSPFADLRLRLTRSRDIRAPNILEIFDTAVQSTVQVVDPRTNTPVAFQGFTLGNANLRPEIGNTLTFGGVYSPSWLPGFTASVDAYRINIKGAIGTLTNQQLVDRCEAGNQLLCAQITRNTAGQLTEIRNQRLNLQQQEVNGIDFDTSYRFDLEKVRLPGSFTIRGLASYVSTFRTSDGVTSIDQAGSILNGQPHWSSDITANYQNGGFALNANWVYLGGGSYDNQYIEGVDINDNHVGSTSYFNFQIGYTQELKRRAITYYMNINNAFDQGPPLEFAVNGNNYDRVGRRFVVGVRVRPR